MMESESIALPLGYTPMAFVYSKALRACQGFWMFDYGKNWHFENTCSLPLKDVPNMVNCRDTTSAFTTCVKSASVLRQVVKVTKAYLPIVKEYAYRMGLVAVVNQALDCGMRASPGNILLGLVMNVLCGRSPLYRVEEFIVGGASGHHFGERVGRL
jgi:hypothetical protein